MADDVEIHRTRHQTAVVIQALPEDRHFFIGAPQGVAPLLLVRALSGNYTVDAGIYGTAFVIDVVTASDISKKFCHHDGIRVCANG